jgi:hypothetical protein
MSYYETTTGTGENLQEIAAMKAAAKAVSKAAEKAAAKCLIREKICSLLLYGND